MEQKITKENTKAQEGKRPRRKGMTVLIIIAAAIAAFLLFQLGTYLSNRSKEHIGKCGIEAVHDLEQYKEYYDTLVWNDEFDGTELDRSKWRFEGHRTCRNHELQSYADSEADGNTVLSDGMLHIVGKKEERFGKQYTSASLLTGGKATFKYGRFEMRAKLPGLQGSWPAFWMMGQKRFFSLRSWPFTGEIDIMESISKKDDNRVVYQTLHTPTFKGFEYFSIGENYRLSGGTFDEDFHVFGFIWTDKELAWYVDDRIVQVIDITDEKFDIYRRYADYMLVNLAVGGSWPGSPEEGDYRDEYVIDYVRVYQ